jgi:hypothetical protein
MTRYRRNGDYWARVKVRKHQPLDAEERDYLSLDPAHEGKEGPPSRQVLRRREHRLAKTIAERDTGSTHNWRAARVKIRAKREGRAA